MQFALICIGALVALGIVAALASALTKGGTDAPTVEGHDCATCSSVASGECKIGCLLEEKRRREGEINGEKTRREGEINGEKTGHEGNKSDVS